MKKMIFAGALCLMTAVAGANFADASDMSSMGKVRYVYTYAYDTDSTTNNAVYGSIHLAPTTSFAGGPGYAQYCITRNPTLLAQAQTALANNTTVRMYCTGTFPTSGSYRYGGWVDRIYSYVNM